MPGSTLSPNAAAHPSSSTSTFGQHTPALSRTSFGASSSPATDVIATPSDRYDAVKGGGNTKQPRRSVRIRTSSGGVTGGEGSSPQLSHHLSGAASFLQEHDGVPLHHTHHLYQHSLPLPLPQQQEMPHRARAIRTLPPPTAPANATSSSRRSLGPQGSDTFAVAQAHGITADQFEEAKAQVLRFLSADQQQQQQRPAVQRSNSQLSLTGSTGSPNFATVQLPPLGAAYGQQPLARTPTSAAPPSSTSYAHSALQSAIELEPPFNPHPSLTSAPASVRARPSFEDVVSRSAKRPRTSASATASGSAMRQWATQGGSGSSSSSSSDEDGPGLASMLTAHRRVASGSGTGIVPPSPSQAGGGARGSMDRFIADRAPQKAAAPEAAVPSVSSLPPPPASPKPTGTAAPESPQRKRVPSYAAHQLLSPAPSKARPGVLFSPDVARLLRSELDELEANELGGRKVSPRKMVDRSSDIVVDDAYASSPFQRSPFSSGGAAGSSRTRDIFSTSAEDSGSKRARWAAKLGSVPGGDNDGPASPTPSHASVSLSMRAPSFCDSSPAQSERGSLLGGGGGAASRTQPALHTYDASSHPASAPDFLYGGVPSSSPTSSLHSEYLPARLHRSSPGPAARLARSDSASTLVDNGGAGLQSHGGVAGAARPAKRGPVLHRQNTGPPYGQGDPHTKPAYSYAALIGQALFSTDDLRMALADIYVWVMQHYPYFKKSDAGWQNSIRHNLSLNPCFIKTARAPDNPGKGCLWQIKPGTEDQFVDGDFIRKGGQPTTRRSRGKGKKAAAAAAALAGEDASSQNESSPEKKAAPSVRVNPQDLLRPMPVDAGHSSSTFLPPRPTRSNSGGRSPSASFSARATSPALSVASSAGTAHTAQRTSLRAYSPALSAVSARSVTPALASSPLPPPPMTLAAPVHPPHQTLTFTMPPPPLVPSSSIPVSRPATAIGLHRTESEPHLAFNSGLSAQDMTARSHSSMGFIEQPHARRALQQQPQRAETIVEHEEEEQKPRLLAPAISRTTSLPVFSTAPRAPASPPPSSGASAPPRSQSHLHEPLLSATMSPPTSVYHRLAGPYQPLSMSFGTPGRAGSAGSRALALLASPEARGPFAERGEQLLGSASGLQSAPLIFSGAGGVKRSRTESEKEDRGAFGSLLSPGALVHTQSPISSLRGGPRQPMSPVQNSSDKLEPQPDPEKKLAPVNRVAGTRLLPAINALASSASGADALFDPFRSPPPSSYRAHLRSPSASARLQAGLCTPGGTKGRMPLGFSPSLAGGGAWGVNHPSSSSRSSAWDDAYGADDAMELDAPGRFAWPSTPGMGISKEW
ncbi:hypothetical protein JCM10213_001980 [Rhodosporidiobolus nylandii]